jgi:hypothetical protein
MSRRPPSAASSSAFVDHKLDGDVTTARVSTDSTGDGFDLSDTVTLGIRQRIACSFRLLGGVEWSNAKRSLAL